MFIKYYTIYLNQSDYNIGQVNDHMTFNEAISSTKSDNWIIAKK